MSDHAVCLICGASATVHVTNVDAHESGSVSEGHYCKEHGEALLAQWREAEANPDPAALAAIAEHQRRTADWMHELLAHLETHGAYPPEGHFPNNPLALSPSEALQARLPVDILAAALRHALAYFAEHGRLPDDDELPREIGRAMTARQLTQLREVIAYVEAHGIAPPADALPGNPYLASLAGTNQSLVTSTEYLRVMIQVLEEHRKRFDAPGTPPEA